MKINQDLNSCFIQIDLQGVIDPYCSIKERLNFFGKHLKLFCLTAMNIDVENRVCYKEKSSYTTVKLIKFAVENVFALKDRYSFNLRHNL